MRPFDELLEAIPKDIETIHRTAAGAADHPLRTNREMLEAYFRLSNALGSFLHGGSEPVNATFATFAAWSAQSLKAEVDTDDGEGSGDEGRRRRRRRPARWMYDTAVDWVLTDRDAIARNIANGQAAVYEEIGPALWLFLNHTIDAVAAGRATDDGWKVVWDEFSNALIKEANELRERRRQIGRGGGVLDEGGVGVLQRGFEPYFEVLRTGASAATDPAQRKLRAERILLGNIRLVAYEQKRLQPVLERNLGYLPHALRLRVATRWLARDSMISRGAFRLYKELTPQLQLIDEAFQIAATRHVYSMILGEEELRFGVDVPLPPPAHPILRDDCAALDRDRYEVDSMFPHDLLVFETPELWSEWQQYDHSIGQGGRTAVDSWLRYPERLNWILHVFRSRQQLSTLYDRPDPSAPARPPSPVLGTVHDELVPTAQRRLERAFAVVADPASDGS